MKKSFRGYNVAETDAKIKELETEIQDLNSKNNVMDARFHDAQAKIDEFDATISAKDNQLNSLSHENSALTAEASRLNREINSLNSQIATLNSQITELKQELRDNNKVVDSIGKMYVKAFESGKQIVLSPKTRVNEFLDKVDEASNNAISEFAVANQDISILSNNFNSLIASINSQTLALQNRVNDVFSSIGVISDGYKKFDEVKQKTNQDISDIVADYDNYINEFSNEAESVPAASVDPVVYTPIVQPVMNVTNDYAPAAQSIVQPQQSAPVQQFQQVPVEQPVQQPIQQPVQQVPIQQPTQPVQSAPVVTAPVAQVEERNFADDSSAGDFSDQPAKSSNVVQLPVQDNKDSFDDDFSSQDFDQNDFADSPSTSSAASVAMKKSAGIRRDSILGLLNKYQAKE